MLPFLAVLGGAAAVEIKNAITGDNDVKQLKRREHELRSKLQNAEQQLHQERHKLKDVIAAKEKLARERTRLEQETRDLSDDRRRLAESEAQLRRQEATLQAANDRLAKDKETLAKQLEELKIKQEAALQRLRAQVGSVIERFAAGNITSQSLLTQLRELGVELTDDANMPQLTATMMDDERRSTKHHLPMEPAWTQQLQLVLDRPERMRALAAAGAALSDPERMKAALPTASQPALPGVKNPAPIAASGSWLGRAAGSVALLRADDKDSGSDTGTPSAADKLAGKLQAQLVTADVSPPPAGGMLKLSAEDAGTPKKSRSLIPALRLGSAAPSNKGVQSLSEGPAASKKMLPNVAAKQLGQRSSSSTGGGQLMTL